MGDELRRREEADAIDWTTPHRLARLRDICGDVEAPWKLVPHTATVTGTIILHDANGVAIADLYTQGPPCPCDKLIALAPTAILQLVDEVESLRRLDRERRFAAGEWVCVACGRTPVDTFGGYCIDCDAAEEETHG